MDDPKPLPSDPHRSPERREEQELVAGAAHPEGPFSSEPVRDVPDVPEYERIDVGGPAVEYTDPAADVARPHEPLADALPGDAAPTEVIPLAEPAEVPPAVVIEEREVVDDAAPVATVGPAHGHGSFTLWLLIWLAFWTGGMALTLNHRFDRPFDWNTSYFSIAARNLVRDGFVARHGGLHLNAGDVKDYPAFYSGHPPLTAWLLYGWMKAFGTDRDWVIRSLPLTFTVLNLLLLFALVRRVFGPPAALAVTVVCSLLPMTAYYAQVVNMEPFVLTFVLGASLGYLAWSRSGSRLGYLLLCACVILGCWTDWPMYVFAGLLAVVHFFARRPGAVVETRGGEDEVVRPRRPVLSTLVLLLLPAAMFGLFVGYLSVNGASVKELWYRASERLATAAEGASTAPATAATSAPAMAGSVAGATTQPTNGYQLLLERFTHRSQLKAWLLDVFTPAALMLAVIGLALWPRWSRRLSIAGGEAGRRAVFRILLCIVLTQLTYTLVFAQAAWEHEFWQYYLTVPVALLAGGLCTWLTVAGGPERGFFWGLMDRAGWSVAALIPLLAIGPFAHRMHLRLPGRVAPAGEESRTQRDYVDALRRATNPGDVILTDWEEKAMGMALPWYADRTIVAHFDVDQETRSLPAIGKLREQFKNRRVFYLWGDQGPESLFETLTKTFPQEPAGPVMLYRIHEPGQADVPLPGASSTTTTAPSATATAPVTRPTAPAATRPVTTTAPAAATKPAP